MSVKLLMKWDIKESQQQEYFEFVVREWGPGLNKLGLEVIGLWLSTYAQEDGSPKIMAEALTDNLADMKRILASDDWKVLHGKLMECVENYSQKIVRTSGEFQL
ncbi:MAG: hypothetical protein MUF38_12030 [Anaerolineae bacterium]|jgi:hypothetical protein|nr:hypothetical protein [Anaerolineae bacterium]